MSSFEQKITPGFLVRFTLPSIVMMVFNSFYTMVDGGFVSNFVGTDALSAVNIVFPVMNLVLAIGIMLATGGSAVVAKQMGEGKLDKARQNFSLIAVWGVGLGIVIGLLGVLCTDFFVTILGANAATYGYCYDYLFYMSLFTPFCILQLFFQFFFVTAGKPNLGLASTVAGGVANMVLDYVLIVPGDLGIAGAAIATGIGWCIPAVVGIAYFTAKRNELLWFVKPVSSAKTMLKTCANGSSEMVSNLAVAITTYLFNIIMMQKLGSDGVAAMTIVFYAQFLFTAVFFGYTSGVAPLFSFHYGAQNEKQLQRLFRSSLWFFIVCSIAACLASILLAKQVVGIFAQSESDVFELASHGMNLFAIGFLFMGLNIFASGLFTALSNGKVSAILSFLRTFVFIVLAIYLLPKWLEVNGIWLAIPVAEFLALLVAVWYMVRLRPHYRY